MDLKNYSTVKVVVFEPLIRLTNATLNISAASPWIPAFMACRSAALLTSGVR